MESVQDAPLIQDIDFSGVDPERIVYLSESTGRVCSELRKRHAAGLSLSPEDIRDADPALLLAVFDAFGCLDKALIQAALPQPGVGELPKAELPAKPPVPALAKPRQSPAAEELMAEAPLVSRNEAGPSPEPRELTSALETAPAADLLSSPELRGGDEPATTSRRVKSKDVLIKAIEELTEEPWDREQIILFRRKWGPSVKAHFGDWIVASRVLGIPEWQFSSERLHYLLGNADLVLDLLRDRHEAGEQVDAATIFQEDRDLWEAAKRLYGSFTSCLKALELN